MSGADWVPAEPAHLRALPPIDDEILDREGASEPVSSPARRTWEPWRTWDPTVEAPGPFHGPRRDLADGGKEIPWQRGARPAELVYWATSDHRPPVAGITVVLVEGEKAADAVAEAGYEAVATVCGAASDPSEAVVRHLAAYQLVVAPDHDEPGRRHMARLLEALALVGVSSCRLVDPPPWEPEHWDLADVDQDRRRELIRAAHEIVLDIPSGTSDAPGARMHFPTARELFAHTPAETSWRVEGLLPEAALTELDGAAKKAGKTTFVAHLVRAVLEGEPFLGRATRRTPVVVLSEQPVASLRASFAGAGLLEREDLWILTWHQALGQAWTDIAAEAIDASARNGAGLLVVDTLPQWAGLRGDSENDAGAALEAVAPLQAAAAAGLTVLLVRHDRKASGDVGDSARGSSAFGGAVDVILQLRRGTPDERSTVRHLAALSRFPETPDELVIELVDHSGAADAPTAGTNGVGYVVLGDGPGYAKAEARLKILETIGEAELRRAEIEERTGVSGERLTEALGELVAGGYLERAGRGVKGDPQRFRRVTSIHSGAPPHYVRGALPNGIEPPSRPVDDLTDQAVEIFGDFQAEAES